MRAWVPCGVRGHMAELPLVLPVVPADTGRHQVPEVRRVPRNFRHGNVGRGTQGKGRGYC